jgi:thiamine pyrophosphokinase
MTIFNLQTPRGHPNLQSTILMYAVIVASAPELDIAPYQEHIRAADLLIAADGGALPLLRAGIVPHVAIGDMDSIDAAGLAELEAHAVTLRRFPREKDETDLELALLYAAAAGATTIDILGALGGRWDHTLANVALLALPELCERRTRLLADHQTLFLVRDTATLEGQAGDTVSLLPLAGAAHGVTTKGLRYPLDDATLSYERARGVSNVLLDPPGHVSLREGLLLVVQHAGEA